MPLQTTSGAASYDAFGGGVPVEPVYIEQIFSTYLYTGNGSTQTITNGIDLAGEGGLVWVKPRIHEFGLSSHWLLDTLRGVNSALRSNTTNAALNPEGSMVSAFNTTGFSLGSNGNVNNLNDSLASWTFRKQPKFFDVVTYTGNGSNRTIAHDLGSVPGCIIVKKTSGADNWFVQHRSLGATKYIALNDADIAYTNSQMWNNTEPTSTVFTLGTNSGVNQSGGTYVAYIFAHDAGGFGLTGLDNVISCGSYAGTGVSGQVATLGYEPQWVLIKSTLYSGNWFLWDTMRGMPVGSDGGARLLANTSGAESSVGASAGVFPTSTGFGVGGGADGLNQSGETYIYIAIRRGPMKVPTSGTQVFTPIARTGTGSAANITSAGFPPDLLIGRSRLATTSTPVFVDRLRGNTKFLQTAFTDAEGTSAAGGDVTGFLMNGFSLGFASGTDLNSSGASEIYYPMQRAPGFFDEVCYTGTGSATTVTHNLGVAPELMIVKGRSNAENWAVYTAPNKFFYLDSTIASVTSTGIWNNTAPSSTVFSLGPPSAATNSSGINYVAYLFATCAGVSKVGSYTGTGTTLQINCGFTGGARFVMIKRTDSTGDWYVWDSARGIVAGNDPYLLLNSTAAEVTNTDYVDTYSAGFEISSTAPAAINANGGTFIFLAIA